MRIPSKEKQQKVERLRQLAGKHPTWFIADELGYTFSSLQYLATTNKISLAYTNKRVSKEDKDLVLHLRDTEKLTFKQIGRKLPNPRSEGATKRIYQLAKEDQPL